MLFRSTTEESSQFPSQTDKEGTHSRDTVRHGPPACLAATTPAATSMSFSSSPPYTRPFSSQYSGDCAGGKGSGSSSPSSCRSTQGSHTYNLAAVGNGRLGYALLRPRSRHLWRSARLDNESSSHDHQSCSGRECSELRLVRRQRHMSSGKSRCGREQGRAALS